MVTIDDPGSAARLSIMTFNLRVRTLLDGTNRWSKRVDSVSAMIRTHSPGLLATQEGLPGMLRDLKKRLPDYTRIGRGRNGQGGEHCAIFYRQDELELLETGQFWLSYTPDVPSKSWGSACRRICTWAKFQTNDSSTVQFFVFNTHLDHVSQQAREQGSKLIWMKMREFTLHQSIPVLLMGDFNAAEDNTVIRFWRGQTSIDGSSADFTDVVAKQGIQAGTFHGFQGGETAAQIDYIFATPHIQVMDARIDTRMFLGRYPSDHYPVTASVELRACR